MTFLGKTLVLINCLLSGFAAVWAFGLYYNNVDWSDKRAQGDTPAGKLGERLVQIDAMKQRPGLLLPTWDKTRTKVHTDEQDLREDRTWYASKSQHNDSLANEEKPALEVERDDKNIPAMEGKRLKLLEVKTPEGKPLQSLQVYDKEAEEKNRQVIESVQKLEKLIQEDSQLTEQVVGNKENAGLLLQIEIEKAKILGLTKERELLQPFLTNIRVDADLVLSRRNDLEQRLKELDKQLEKYKIDLPRTP